MSALPVQSGSLRTSPAGPMVVGGTARLTAPPAPPVQRSGRSNPVLNRLRKDSIDLYSRNNHHDKHSSVPDERKIDENERQEASLCCPSKTLLPRGHAQRIIKLCALQPITSFFSQRGNICRASCTAPRARGRAPISLLLHAIWMGFPP